MAYTLADLETDIKGYTEVNSNVFTTAVLNRFITNAEAKIYRAVDADLERHYATSSLVLLFGSWEQIRNNSRRSKNY